MNDKPQEIGADQAFDQAGAPSAPPPEQPPPDQRTLSAIEELARQPIVSCQDEFEVPEVGTVTVIEIFTREPNRDPKSAAKEFRHRFANTGMIRPEKLIHCYVSYRLPKQLRQREPERQTVRLKQFFKFVERPKESREPED